MDPSSVTGVIIGLSAGLENKTMQDPPYMWIGNETRLRAAAAAKLWQQNPNALILFSGGHPSRNVTPSEASTMEDYVKRPPWNVPAERIITENESIDTASNIRDCVAIIRKRDLPENNVTLIAGVSNLSRAAAYLRAYCISPKALLARPVLGDDIEKYNLPLVSDAMSFRARLVAFILRAEQLIDRRGYLVTLYKWWQLHRHT